MKLSKAEFSVQPDSAAGSLFYLYDGIGFFYADMLHIKPAGLKQPDRRCGLNGCFFSAEN